MKQEFKQYSFTERNQNSLIFLPGYSGGLTAPIIHSLLTHFQEKKNIDVLGIELPYDNDHTDEFDISQSIIVDSVASFSQEFPDKDIYIVAKSLGGALALFNSDRLPIKGLVMLGSSIVLGWPQRISLLSAHDPVIPDYKQEWTRILQTVSIPVRIITGEKDDLADNSFLVQTSEENKNIRITQLENTNHNLQDITSGKIHDQECVKIIENLIS